MAAPSPIHRDPDADGDDYGCVGPQASLGNAAVARLVDEACGRLRAGRLGYGDELVYFVRCGLERINATHGCGSCDTVVKENVFAALKPDMEEAGIEDFDFMQVYGW